MQRKRIRRDVDINCISFYRDKGGSPQCKALKTIYCLVEDKPCNFKKARGVQE